MYNYLINKSTLEFDKIYYVDSEIGNDTNGNGEELTPYKTIEKAYSLIANESCAIVLKGTFVDPVLTVNKNIFFIGYCEDTVIQISTIANFLTVSSSNINVNFYRLIINLEGVSR